MAYCDRTDIETIYGKTNVEKWADLDGKRVAPDIAARIVRACAVATAKIDTRLRGGPYALPLDPVPIEIVDLTARYAAYLLYVGRPIKEDDETTHPVKSAKNEVEKELANIRGGRVQLDLPIVAIPYPTVIEDE